MTRQERSAYIFYFVLAVVLTGLLTISDNLQADYVLLVAAALVRSIYNWFTGYWNVLQSLSCVTFMLGLWFWSRYRSTAAEGDWTPWWGSLLFVLPGLVLYSLGGALALKRAKERGNATTTRAAG